MIQKTLSVVIFFFGLFALSFWQSISFQEQHLEPKRVKLVLRDIGHELLLSIKDSTTRVSPVKELSTGLYQISFEKNLEFEPSVLVSIIKKRFEVSGLANYYFVEVLNCKTSETVYSFEIAQNESQTIVPCKGRNLPKDCYTIKISFESGENQNSNDSIIIYGSLGMASLLIFLLWFKTTQPQTKKPIGHFSSLGNLDFSQDQLKLIHNSGEIILSRKECEILSILIENLNKITTREELVKRVWEDQGVVVGRSLDTYISKLRKKLKIDPSLKLSNIHGVGYKLEDI